MSVMPSHRTNEKKDFKAILNAIEIYCSCQMTYDNTSKDDDMINVLSVVNSTMVAVNVSLI